MYKLHARKRGSFWSFCFLICVVYKLGISVSHQKQVSSPDFWKFHIWSKYKSKHSNNPIKSKPKKHTHNFQRKNSEGGDGFSEIVR